MHHPARPVRRGSAALLGTIDAFTVNLALVVVGHRDEITSTEKFLSLLGKVDGEAFCHREGLIAVGDWLARRADHAVVTYDMKVKW